MKISTAVLGAGVLGGGLFLAATFGGCGDDDPQKTEVARFARKGEACQTTNDCAGGLACLPSDDGLGTCVVGVFNVAPTSKECAIIECTKPEDCCEDPASESVCEAYLSSCDAGSPSSCQLHETNCQCKAEKFACENGRCHTKCITDDECEDTPGAGSKCLGGKCGECATDEECKGPGRETHMCVNGRCAPPCQGDGDCAGFNRCQNGRCNPGGCTSTRECIAATRNVEATCGTDGKCIVPCQTDLECGNPKGYSFFSCINGQCLSTGCETDKDCSLLIRGPGTSSGIIGTSSGDPDIPDEDRHIICREKQVPNPTTRPAN